MSNWLTNISGAELMPDRGVDRRRAEVESCAQPTPECRMRADMESRRGGALIVNADDWGRDDDTTERIAECVRHGSVSSVSAMVFMEDSEQSAALARERGIDAGLHLNLTTPFSASAVPTQLAEHQRRLARYLRSHRLAPALFHPGLRSSFAYVVRSQLEEFRRLYGASPERIDGHHHMHLSANVLIGRLLPEGTMVRRNFTFRPGEKSWVNRAYRSLIDHVIESRHQVTDFFFCLPPLEPQDRLQRIFSLAQQFVVELETHPVNPDEYRFLHGAFLGLAQEVRIAPRYLTSRRASHAAN